MRQGGRHTRGDEAGEAVDDQRAEENRRVACGGGQQRADPDHREQSRQVCDDEHLPAIPAVQQRAGERTQQRIRQVQRREGAGDGPRVGLALRIEQQAADQTGLEKSVAELADHAQFQQPAKVRQRLHRMQDDVVGTAVGHWNIRVLICECRA